MFIDINIVKVTSAEDVRKLGNLKKTVKKVGCSIYTDRKKLAQKEKGLHSGPRPVRQLLIAREGTLEIYHDSYIFSNSMLRTERLTI